MDHPRRKWRRERGFGCVSPGGARRPSLQYADEESGTGILKRLSEVMRYLLALIMGHPPGEGKWPFSTNLSRMVSNASVGPSTFAVERSTEITASLQSWGYFLGQC